MGPAELLVLSMGLSIAVSALALAGGGLVERLSGDPVLRDRTWGVALALSLAPLLVTIGILLTPAPVREVATPILVHVATPAMDDVAPAVVARRGFTPTFDQLALLIMGAAAVLAGLKAVGLVLRSLRLARILRTATPADAMKTRRVARAAEALGVAAPATLISTTAAEALLSGLGRARLVLPDALTDETADAVITHELAHLKRGDHRGLWLEETVAVLLAFNPLVPLLRAKRDGAREEACDALALGDAAPEARQAYAQTLIEALRNRAGSQSPALTFTGAGRSTAMRRLKAVMTPAAPAGRRTRLIAGAAGLALLTAVGGATAALAGQREAEIRMIAAPEQTEGPRQLLNGQPLPDGLPAWALNPERVEIGAPGGGDGSAVNFILPLTGTTPVSVNGRRLPEGFPVRGINPDAVARVDMQGDHLMVTLKPENEVQDSRGRENVAAAAQERAEASTANAARFRRASAEDYKRYCASDEPGENGFCMGVMLGHLGRAAENGLCLPDGLRPGAEDAAVDAYLVRGRAEVSRLSPRSDEGAYEYSMRALTQAYPCRTAGSGRQRAAAGETSAPARSGGRLQVNLSSRAEIQQGDLLTVKLAGSDADGVRYEHISHVPVAAGGALPDGLFLDLTRDYFPALGERRAYELTAEVQGANGRVYAAAQPSTVRLAPGADISRLRPELVLERVAGQ